MNVQFTIKNEQVMLRADEQNYEVCKLSSRKDRDTGEECDEWVPFKFFASLEQALSRIIDMKVRASDARTLEELKKDYDESFVNEWLALVEASKK